MSVAMSKCAPFYLPREFTCVIVASVYVPSDGTDFSTTIIKLHTLHPDGAIYC